MYIDTHNAHLKATRRAAFRAAFPHVFGPLETDWTQYEAANVHVAIVDSLRSDRDSAWRALVAESR